ncbi:MAG: phosphoglucosamine mutase [Candidatus Rokubacteria bacterium]|nr:phosphoglucosamine mutase [Candidatus Rokubacteria bacterium]
MSRLFGTDGIRGVANAEPLTTELAFRLGRQLVATLLEHHGVENARLVVGRDTRLSGPMLEGALVSGALSAGGDVYAVGVLPTPAIAYLTRALEAHGGVVLSASHNPFEDNGIKIFSSEGSKFPDAWEDEIESRLRQPDAAPKPTGASIGRHLPHASAEADYVGYAIGTCPVNLTGLSIVVDCAHGATYRVAPRVFRGLGARVTVLGARPDGRNINLGSGALHPETLRRKVLALGAHLGVAFDGDGDRLISVDERGEIRDGDYALAICARHLAAQGRLRGQVLVTTVMANLGLDRALGEAGIRTVKTQVGDRYVLEEMLRLGANLGGEQSGHLLFLDHATTGDAIVSALQLLTVMRETGKSLSALSTCLTKFPQVLLNVPVREKRPLEDIPGLTACAEGHDREMNGSGRILLRYSGTEALLRVMVEGEDQSRIERMAAELAGMIQREIGRR